MTELLKVMAQGLVENPDAVNVTVDEPDEEGVIAVSYTHLTLPTT